MAQRGILEIIILIFVSVIAGVVSNYFLALPVSDTIIIFALTFLVILAVALYLRLRNIDSRLTGMTRLSELFIDAFGGVQEELLNTQSGTIKTCDLYRIFGQPLGRLHIGLGKGFLEILKSGSPKEHEEISKLLEKANREEITPKEIERLRQLLVEEKKKREQADDILGAIAVGLVILSVLGLLMSLLAGKKRK